MLKKTVIATGVADANATTAVEMLTSPNLPGTTAIIYITMITNPTMTGVVEGSDDNVVWADLVNTGAVDLTNTAIPAFSSLTEVTLPKFLRVKNTSYTDGVLDAFVINAN